MNEQNRIKYLKIALWVFGFIFAFGFYPLTKVWPSGWTWHADGRSYYLEMMIGVYATLGLFLIYAARNPLQHSSLIWFTVWSSVVHGGIMTVQSLDGSHISHLYADVPALFIAAVVLGLLMPRNKVT